MLPETLFAEVRRYHEGQDPGHDWGHILRVVASARLLAREEGADEAVVVPAAYLHDCVNVPKDHPERHRASELAADKAITLLAAAGHDSKLLPAIHRAIVEHSFSRGLAPSTKEAAVVQDADRLDALGSIGVLRCASVCTSMGGSFYDPDDLLAERRPLDDRRWMLDHYAAKLFKLPDTMATAAGKRLAQERAAFMRGFITQLRSELDGKA